MPKESEKKRFWTFLVSSTHVVGGSAYATGHFVFMRISSEDSTRNTSGPSGVYHEMTYLTPFDSPITLEVTEFIEASSIEDISPRAVVEALTHLFGADFTPIPRPPLEIPSGRIPPSVRKKLMEKHKKMSNQAVKGVFR